MTIIVDDEDFSDLLPAESVAAPDSNIQNLDISNAVALEQEFVALSPGIKTAKLRAGEILHRLRALTPHGEWELRLKSLCKQVQISRSSAHSYVRAYQKSIGEAPKLTERKERTTEGIVLAFVKLLNSRQTRDALIAVLDKASYEDFCSGVVAEMADGADFLDHILYRCKASPYSPEQREGVSCRRCVAAEKMAA